jgi:hypothetical protein
MGFLTVVAATAPHRPAPSARPASSSISPSRFSRIVFHHDDCEHDCVEHMPRLDSGRDGSGQRRSSALDPGYTAVNEYECH